MSRAFDPFSCVLIRPPKHGGWNAEDDSAQGDGASRAAGMRLTSSVIVAAGTKKSLFNESSYVSWIGHNVSTYCESILVCLQGYGGGMRPPLNALGGPGMPGMNM